MNLIDAIDIMVPFYGDARHLRETVRSVLRQSDPAWRLVCVDDAYPGQAACDAIAEVGDPRVIYVRNPENLGVAGNFNRCLDLVEAVYFVMMGGDDIMLPDYIATVRELASQHPAADVLQPGVQVIDGAGSSATPLADRIKKLVRPMVTGTSMEIAGEQMATSLARADWAYFPSLLWRTSTVRRVRFDERWATALDLALLFDIALTNGTMAVSDHVCFLYRRHRASASARAAIDGHRFAQEHALLDEYADRLEQAGWRDAGRWARARPILRASVVAEAGYWAAKGKWHVASLLLRHVWR